MLLVWAKECTNVPKKAVPKRGWIPDRPVTEKIRNLKSQHTFSFMFHSVLSGRTTVFVVGGVLGV
jgi:hypothetical protein